MLQAALAAGVSAAGGEALLGGVLPTPAAPLLIKRYGFDLAAVISASHNPYQDNGIKFFAADGFKLSDEQEQAIEAELRAEVHRRRDGPGGWHALTVRIAVRMRRLESRCRARAAHAMACARCPVPPDHYLRRAAGALCRSHDLDGTRRRPRLANGATFVVAPEIFRRLGAHVTVLQRHPMGATSTTAAARPTSRPGRAGARGRPRARLRLRRRRRPCARRRPHRRGRRRRRADRARRPSPARAAGAWQATGSS